MPLVGLKHPVAIRWSHWINFPLLAVMVWSGILIYWAYDVYSLGPIHFFPRWFYQTFHVDHKLADGMAMHFFFMWLFAANGVLYVLYTLVSGEWRNLVPWALSSDKYNPAQRLAYTCIVLMGLLSIITGLAIYKPAQLAWLTSAVGGYPRARLLHFWLTLGYVGFFLIHITQVARAGWHNFRAMVDGYALKERA